MMQYELEHLYQPGLKTIKQVCVGCSSVSYVGCCVAVYYFLCCFIFLLLH
jgi:hypothetical protein